MRGSLPFSSTSRDRYGVFGRLYPSLHAGWLQLLLLILVALLPFLPLAQPVVAAGPQILLNQGVSTTTVDSGVLFNYTFSYSCSSTVEPCRNVQLTTVVPPELEPPLSSDIVNTVHVANWNYNAGTRVITWNFVDPLPAGSTGVIQVSLLFTSGSTPNGTPATSTSTITSSNAGNVTTPPVTITATATNESFTQKNNQGSVIESVSPYQARLTYRVQVCSPSDGALNVSNITMVDTLPPGAEYVSSTGGGVYDIGTGTVTWTGLNLTLTSSRPPNTQCTASRDVTVRFSAPTFSPGQQVTNNAASRGTPLGGTEIDLPGASRNDNLPTPSSSAAAFSKSGPGQVTLDPPNSPPFRYSFPTQNTSNIINPPLQDYTIVDTIPPQIEVLSIRIGRNNQPAGTVQIDVQYQTNLNATWTSLPGYPGNTPNPVQDVLVSSLGLGPTEYITAIRWIYPTLPHGFNDSSTNERNGFQSRLLETDRLGIPVLLGSSVVNNATRSYERHDGTTATNNASSTATVIAPATVAPDVSLFKAVIGTNRVNPGQTITYRVEVQNRSSGTANLIEPVMADFLNGYLEYVPGSWSITHNITHTVPPSPVFEQLDNHDSTGQTLLRWSWQGTGFEILPSNTYVRITFQVRVKPGTPSGTNHIGNRGYLVETDNTSITCNNNCSTTADTNDFDEDGNRAELIQRSGNQSISVNAEAVLESVKWVRGQLDSTWHRFPESGRTVPGGAVDYRMVIINTGNEPVNTLRVVDILPFVGDTGVIDTTPRDSQWRPQLTGPLVVPAGVTVYYSTSGNPCRTDLVPSGPAGCEPPNWSTIPPADITDVQSFLLDFGSFVLQPLDEIEIQWPMRAPVGTPVGLVSWNSFGYIADPLNPSLTLLPAEPIKVGIIIDPLTPPAYGNYVWLDTDNDGIQDAGETGINGVVVGLYSPGLDGIAGNADDSLVQTTATTDDASGNPGYYLFAGMPTGNYYARFVPPVGYGVTQQDNGDDAQDSDVNAATGLTAITNLTAGEIDLSWDMGLVAQTEVAAIGDYVWIDRNNNGTQDESPSDGINGVTVQLYTAGNVLSGTTTTASDIFGNPGYYKFDNLAPGDYYVRFTLPAGATGFATQDAVTDTLDSDVDATGRTIVTTLSAGEYDPTWDAGIIVPSGNLSLGDRIWKDVDNDGFYEPNDGEAGINGVRVNLYRDSDGNGSYTPGTDLFVATTTSFTRGGVPGFYLFENLAAGSYIVQIDSVNFLSNGALFELASSTPVFDPEVGVGANRNNDNNGASMTGYGVVSQDIILSANNEPNNDGDTDRNTNLTVDFGFRELSKLGDYVWFDRDGDGTQNELPTDGLNGVTVRLYDGSGNLLRTTVTDNDASGNPGYYLFTGLVDGTYQVEFVLPTPLATFTTQDVGGNDAEDSDVNPVTSRTALITLGIAQTDLTWDAGIELPTGPLSLGDRVWNDSDNDGIYEPLSGEVGINGVRVNLYQDSNGNSIYEPGVDPFFFTTTTITDTGGAPGYYIFEDLPAGTYFVQLDELNFAGTGVLNGYGSSTGVADPENNVNDDDNGDPVTGLGIMSQAVVLVAGTEPTNDGDSDNNTNLTVDFGVYQLAALGDYVWVDSDYNGIQDGSESGLPGVTVRLYDGSNNLVDTTFTDSNGNYRFEDLPVGDYYVVFTPPSGYGLTWQDRGSDDNLDSDADRTTGRTITTTLTVGENDLSWDAGMNRVATLGNRVWRDDDQDGIQDSGELGVPGVTVELLDSTGNVTATLITDASGYYTFTNLVPGDYAVHFAPVGYSFTIQDVNSNTQDTEDSDADTTTGRTITTTLTAGEVDLIWDAGIYSLAALGNRVWLDNDRDGLQSGSDVGVAGVTVTLRTAGGTVVGTLLTDSDGYYTFTNLLSGDYRVTFALPAGYAFTTQNAGSDNALDSDADTTTGQTVLTTLDAGEVDLTWDAGIYPLAALGDYVWEDSDQDGVQDAGESGVGGVTVTLHDDTGAVVATTTTDATGAYHFTNLEPGTYSVTFGLPSGYAFTLQDAGGNGVDSDADRTTGATIPTTLIAGEDDVTWDAGIYPLAALGDYVWEDSDQDGVQDAGESGVSGVTVTLYDDTGAVVATTTTDATGAYHFTNLEPGTYSVTFGLPSGYAFTLQDAGGDGVDSDADRTTGATIPTTLVAGEDDVTWDAGIYPLAALGDYVWEDSDQDGVQDAGESGVSGVMVTLHDDTGAVVATTTTDVAGAYHFTNLEPGTYSVTFGLPSGYAFTLQDAGGNGVDSDADRTTGATIPTTLVAGEDDVTWDAGIYPLAALGDYVWEDSDQDGVQDAGESGVGGVTVTLHDDTGAVVASTTTDATGAYHFTNLEPGTYSVTFGLPSGYAFTLQDAGGDGVDSDADRTTGATIPTTLIAGEDDVTWNAGIYPLAALGDYVWEDSDQDGVQDAGESGVGGVTVTLHDDTGAVVATTTTDATGAYHFTDLEPGTYSVTFGLPSGYAFTLQDAGGDGVDSDADRTTGATIPTTLVAGEDDVTWDAGIYPLAALGNYVWEDSDQDGVQDAGESGVGGVTVTLHDDTGAVVATTTTDVAGAYHFTNLEPGTYSVTFGLPSGYAFTLQDAGGDGVDSDADRTTGATILTTLIAGEDDVTWDAGIYPLAALGDYVWEDSDQDGVQDAGESGVSGVMVTLHDDTGAVVASTTTDAAGAYHFTNLEPGTYSVTFGLPSGYAFTTQDGGADDTVDSDADATTGQTALTTLVAGEDDVTWDAGIYPLAALGDYVWEDNDQNGIQDAGESGVGGVMVTLYDEAGVVVATTTTDATGAYHFTNLEPGTYSVTFGLPSGYAFTTQDGGADDTVDSDADATTGQTALTTLVAGEDDVTWDAGIYPLAALGDYVWEDNDQNGIQDAGESGVGGVMVTLHDEAGAVVASTTTDATGAYHFTDLEPGTYSVTFGLPSGYAFTTQDGGADDTVDSDADATTGQTALTTLVAGEDDVTWDAGIYPLAALGNRVWRDDDQDGVQDKDEEGVAGVTVELLIEDVIASTTTDAHGYYTFTNLLPRDYYVRFVLPSGYTFTNQNQGGNAAEDSDADVTTGETTWITLDVGETDLTWDAGIYQLATLGDQVWRDDDQDGIQDGGEPGVANVTVELLDSTGTVTGTTTTDTSGIYTFTNLLPGQYVVRFTLPSGYAFTTQDAGSDNAVDSDADTTTGQTVVTTLSAGETDLRWDAGIYEPAALGDRVWLDNDRNGIQSGSDIGVAGITVTLRTASGTPVGTQLTDSAGYYTFTNLLPGGYRVTFALPDGYAFTTQGAGSDDALDSDADTTTGQTALTTLSAGETDLTWDAGIYELATLGNRVWLDNDRDGLQSGNDVGVSGVTVTLQTADGTLIGTQLTDSAGYYTFTNLLPGGYRVTFALPGGYAFTTQGAGSDDALDSDTDTTTGQTGLIILGVGEEDLTWDAGIYPLAALGDHVWLDTDQDGLQDTDEVGVADVTVTLLDSTGATVATQQTDSTGGYLFTNLQPGSYAVRFTLPTGYAFTTRDAGSDNAVDSDADTTTGQTVNTTLTSGETDLRWDAGIYPLAALGDHVWLDADQDGLQDTDEVGVADVTVTLLDSTGATVATQQTDSTGTYLFTNLQPGSYAVRFTLPTGYAFTTQDAGNDARDSDADTTTGQTVQTTLAAGETDRTWDAGIYQLAALGDYVWLDADQDGLQDTDEVGVADVTVTLLDSTGATVATQQTDSTGTYLFTNLQPGSYAVRFTLPTGYAFTTQDAGNDARDSDADTTTGQTVQTTLAAGETDRTWDAGIYQLAALGDYVWLDTDQDGLQDTDEVGVADVTVTLLDSTGATVATQQTDSTGTYLFTNLQPGSYAVRFTLPSGYVFTTRDAGSDNVVDSDADTTTGQTVNTTLTAGETDRTWDAGISPVTALGDYVWLDSDRDGLQDTDEVGVADVTVTLLDSTGATVATQQTDSTGSYLFTNLQPGSYAVRFTLPTGYAFTTQDAGSDNAVDSDADTTTGQTVQTTLTAGETDRTWDAGISPLATLGDHVWLDADQDGLQDTDEVGVADVTVTLLDSTGATVATQQTDSTGSYLFTNLQPGSYAVRFTLPTGYAFTTQDAGSDNAVDSDADTTTGQTVNTTLTSGETDLRWDAGIYPLAALGDHVWLDTDQDGLQDTDEVGVADVTVALLGSTGATVATQQTDSTGGYLFTNLQPGSYAVRFTLPTGYAFTTQDAGSDNAVDSDADTTTGQTVNTTLTAGETDRTWDAGIYQLAALAALGDQVWLDSDQDGIQDTGETGVADVTVTLLDSTGATVATQTTDSAGGYLFTDLQPGSYAVRFTLPTGYAFTTQDAGSDNAVDSDADTTTGQTVQTTLAAGETDRTWDAGISPVTTLAALGDYVWLDADQDGLQDTDEVGVADVTVTLLDSTGATVATQTTDSTGSYLFTNLQPGSYAVRFTLPTGYAFTTRDAGSDNAVDSDADTTTGQTVNTTLTAGETDLRWDAGIYQLAALGDYVWLDADQDGLQDTDEVGVADVTVTLLDSTGATVATQTTDSTGGYLFTDLQPGSYAVRFTLPTGYAFTMQDAGSDNAVDSDANTTTGQTVNTTLAAGETDRTWDAGIYVSPQDVGLEMDKQVSIDNIAPGQVVTFTIIITNTGIGTALLPVELTDNLPEGLTYIPGSAVPLEPAVNGQELVWSDVTSGAGLAPGQSISVAFQTEVANATGAYRNIAVVEGRYPGGVITDTDDASVIVNDPSVVVNKSVAVPGLVNGIITFTIDITNTGPTLLDVVPLFDKFSGPIEYIGGTPQADVVDNTAQSLRWSDLTTHFGDLAPGAAYHIVTVYRVLPTVGAVESEVRNTATVSNALDVARRPVGDGDDTVVTIIRNTPTAADLLRFTATSKQRGILVQWTTGLEMQTRGFHLWRSSDGIRASAVRITTEPIPAQGRNTGGWTYTWLDVDTTEGTTYTYWLQEVEIDGSLKEYSYTATATFRTIAEAGTRRIFLPFVSR